MATNGWIIERTVDLAHPPKTLRNEQPYEITYTGDMANPVWTVHVLQDGQPVALGGSVKAYIRRIDGAEVISNGTISGNTVSVELGGSNFGQPGYTWGILRYTDSTTNATVTLDALTMIVQADPEGTSVLDPDDMLPTLQELLAELDDMRDATAAAEAAAECIADNYNANATYAVGDYTLHNGGLYRCTTAITSAETWTAAHWTQVVFGSEVRDLKIDINNLYNDDGFLNLGTLIPNTYIQSSDGRQASWNGNSSTDFIRIYGANKIVVNIAATNPYNENAFYAEDKSCISTFGYSAGTTEIEVPANAAYVRFSNITANMNTLRVAINPTYRLYQTTRLARLGAADVFPASALKPVFAKEGETIKFFCSSLLGVDYVTDSEKFRNRYLAPNMEEAVSVPHDSWCIWNSDTNSIQVISNANLASFQANYCPLFYNSRGNVRGLFEKYVIDDRVTDLNPYIWKGNCIVAPYGTANFSIETEGTAISITCNRYIVYNDMTMSWRLCERLSNPTVSVPHDKFLVYINSSNTLEVLSHSEIIALTNKEYYVLFYNSNGKMCGPFEAYYNRYKCAQLESALVNNGNVYPSYYDAHIKTKARIINSELASLSAGDAFVFITDIHYPNNKMYSPSLVRDICNKTGINSVVLNGDYINRETNKNDALIQINRVCSCYEYPNTNTYRVVGNHEFNNPGASSDPEYLANELSAAELRWAIINPNRNKVVYDADSLSYYFDNEKEKIRYFVGAVTRGSGMVAESIRWIAENVENVPAGWGVVIIQHTVLSYAGNVVHVVNEHFEHILNAMKAKTSYNYLGTTFDYSGKEFEFIACFCGDYHLDMDYTTTDGAKIIATTCDTLQQEGDLPRTDGTYNEQAFDVVVVDRTTKKIHMTRIGAGNDREFSFA